MNTFPREKAPWQHKEVVFLKKHKKENLELLSKKLKRSPFSIGLFVSNQKDYTDLSWESELYDLVLAHRYLYYVNSSPVISDEFYDELEKEYLSNSKCRKSDLVRKPGSSKREDYPKRVVALAIYLGLRYGKVIL